MGKWPLELERGDVFAEDVLALRVLKLEDVARFVTAPRAVAGSCALCARSPSSPRPPAKSSRPPRRVVELVVVTIGVEHRIERGLRVKPFAGALVMSAIECSPSANNSPLVLV